MGPEDSLAKLELDTQLLNLSEEESGFLKQQTGITDDEELRKHILEIQAKAWNIFQYGCIFSFNFINLRMSQHFFYKQFIQYGSSRPNALYLEVACCFGTDLRKAIADGYPLENVIASDIQTGFWDLGHALYKSTPETFPIPVIPGDLLSPSLVAPRPPFYRSDQLPAPHPSLKGLTSLTQLQGHLTFIHASLLFHLFDRFQQSTLAKSLASLLSPESGSTIFGIHRSELTAGVYPNFRGGEIYCHTPETWTELWDGEVFEKGSVRVRAEMIERETRGLAHLRSGADKLHLIVWSVTRL